MESRPHGSQGLVGSTAGCEDCGNSVVKWEGGWGGGQGTRSQPLGTSHFQLPRLSRVAGQARIPSHKARVSGAGHRGQPLTRAAVGLHIRVPEGWSTQTLPIEHCWKPVAFQGHLQTEIGFLGLCA